MKLLLLYRSRWWLLYLPVLLCTALALWWSIGHWRVMPPEQMLIVAGSQQSAHARLAQRYADKLERIGVRVEIVNTAKDLESLALLAEGAEPNAMSFAQGEYATSESPLRALAVVGQEPVWIFSRGKAITSLAQAHHARVAAGSNAKSPLSSVAQLMLKSEGALSADVKFEPLGGVAAANALLDGKVDVVFQAASEDSEAIQLLLREPGVLILGVEHGGALAAQNPHLRTMLLPQGVIELRGDIPPRDLTLMSLQTHLVVHPDMHPALQRALIDVAVEIHEFPDFLQHHGEFPRFRGTDFKLSEVAKAYSLGDRPWMENLLPYGKAQTAELLLYAVLPLVIFTVVLLGWIPRLFDWRVSRALNHFYGELKFLEHEMAEVATAQPMALRGLLDRLDRIERKVIELDLPDEFSDRWYTLREHLASARERLLKLRAR
jgi:NMT1/THI5 like